MKRLSSSDSQGALISICPSTEDHTNKGGGGGPGGGGGVYGREFQSMLDGYEEDDTTLFEDSGAGHVAEKKRRLSVDQVKALEKNFEVENKLEPERKVKLAQELGLQPRQVAVWFQNRRARWKTKQLERDYGILKANYDSLKQSLESLQEDNEALMKEIKKLKSKLNEEEDPEKDGLGSESDDPGLEPAITDAPDHLASMEFKDAGPSDSDTSAILNNNTSPKAENVAAASNSNSPPPGFNYLHSGGGGFEFFNLVATTESSSVIAMDKETTTAYQSEYVKMEEHNFFSEEAPCCSNFFSEDQAPTLHWYTPENWT